jgi:hypothetical protein
MDSVEPTQIIKTNKKCSNVNIINGNDNCKCKVETFHQSNTNNKLVNYIRLLMWIILAIVVFLIVRSFII